MGHLWLWLTTATCLGLVAAGVSAERRLQGGSLRGALEALQRRQRDQRPVDFGSFYELILPQAYSDGDYTEETEDTQEPSSKYIIKLLGESDLPPEAYEYKIVRKKNGHSEKTTTKPKESAFRERSHQSNNDKLRELLINNIESEERDAISDPRIDNDAEYAILLSQLWSKYKNHKPNSEPASQRVVELYNEKHVNKRYPDNWGPIAFKRKRSSGSEFEQPIKHDLVGGRKPHGDGMPVDPNYTSYDLTDEDKDDMREEYAIAFQPLDDDSDTDLNNNEQYAYETVEQHLPINKRSSGFSNFNKKKRSASTKNNHASRPFISVSGTDPKIIKDLSTIFGEAKGFDKKQVKRSSDNEEHHDYMPPQVTALSHNESQIEHNHTGIVGHESHVHHKHDVRSHDEHVHLHHPGMTKESDDIIDHQEKPLNIKKKSIDWSDYFGIDKRNIKTYDVDRNIDQMKKEYFALFDKQVLKPSNTYGAHYQVKRNYAQNILKSNEIQTKKNIKRDTSNDENASIDKMNTKLKNMEGLIVDEALSYSSTDEPLDSKEEQEMKEKLVSKMATAYSLEKMRKALKEFKQNLKIQKHQESSNPSSLPTDTTKTKRLAMKRQKAIRMKNDIPPLPKVVDNEEFEDEQGAGQYWDGRTEEEFSEGYMGGSGRQKIASIPTVSATGSCPVLARIVQRCHGVDLLAGDRGQLFLPLCSLHQICYLCGEGPPTTCDLAFLSEADTACEGDMECQQGARSVLMTLRDLHDSLSDELDGECEASPCLPATLKHNADWQRALQR